MKRDPANVEKRSLWRIAAGAILAVALLPAPTAVAAAAGPVCTLDACAEASSAHTVHCGWHWYFQDFWVWKCSISSQVALDVQGLDACGQATLWIVWTPPYYGDPFPYSDTASACTSEPEVGCETQSRSAGADVGGTVQVPDIVEDAIREAVGAIPPCHVSPNMAAHGDATGFWWTQYDEDWRGYGDLPGEYWTVRTVYCVTGASGLQECASYDEQVFFPAPATDRPDSIFDCWNPGAMCY